MLAWLVLEWAYHRLAKSPLGGANMSTPMHFFDDSRYAIRSLSRAPSFSLLVILILALGIGASTAMFSGISTLLLNPVA